MWENYTIMNARRAWIHHHIVSSTILVIKCCLIWWVVAFSCSFHTSKTVTSFVVVPTDTPIRPTSIVSLYIWKTWKCSVTYWLRNTNVNLRIKSKKFIEKCIIRKVTDFFWDVQVPKNIQILVPASLLLYHKRACYAVSH